MILSLAAYLSLFTSAFLSATILPLSPDAVAAYMAANGYALILVIAVAALGSYLGSCTTYYLGYLSRENILKKRLEGEEKNLEKYHKIFARYGEPIILLSWVPVIGDIFIGIAGIFGINFFIFSFYAILGKIIRFSFVVYAAERFL